MLSTSPRFRIAAKYETSVSMAARDLNHGAVEFIDG